MKLTFNKTTLLISSIISIWAMTMVGCKDKDKDDPKPVVEAPKPLFKYTSNGKDFIGVAAYTIADTNKNPPFNGILELEASNADESETIQFDIKARGTGTFQINDRNANYTNFVFYQTDQAIFLDGISGSVIITKYDLTANKLSGTFTLNLGPSSFGTDITKVITNGEFNDVPFTK